MSERLEGSFRECLLLREVEDMSYEEIAEITGLPAGTVFTYAIDWNGDGVRTPGIYRNGLFYIRNSNTTGGADVVFPFGAPGDSPVCGDWDGDRDDTVGVWRGSNWFLNNQNDASGPEYSFSYGNASGDTPLAGNWDGVRPFRAGDVDRPWGCVRP